MTDLTDREIRMSHTIDDLCTDVDKLRRCVRRQLDLLDVVPHAISHGQFGVAEEYVERAVTALRDVLAATGTLDRQA